MGWTRFLGELDLELTADPDSGNGPNDVLLAYRQQSVVDALVVLSSMKPGLNSVASCRCMTSSVFIPGCKRTWLSKGTITDKAIVGDWTAIGSSRQRTHLQVNAEKQDLTNGFIDKKVLHCTVEVK